MKNTGHRLGASGTSLENTLEGLRNSSEHPKRSGFRYWEFDIRESSDGIVFVFHDDTIVESGSQYEIAEMTFQEIRGAGLQMGISIPLFSEVCENLEGTEEMVMVEIKDLRTDKARSEVLDTLGKMGHWKAMATPARFSASFPVAVREEWGRRFESAGVELVRVGRHRLNMFEACKSGRSWLFAQPRWLFGL